MSKGCDSRTNTHTKNAARLVFLPTSHSPSNDTSFFQSSCRQLPWPRSQVFLVLYMAAGLSRALGRWTGCKHTSRAFQAVARTVHRMSSTAEPELVGPNRHRRVKTHLLQPSRSRMEPVSCPVWITSVHIQPSPQPTIWLNPGPVQRSLTKACP